MNRRFDGADDIYESVTTGAVLRRFGAILFALVYLAFVTHVFSLVTSYSRTLCGLAIGLAAVTIMVVLTLFGVRAVDHERGRMRFSISTMLLVIVPVSIYLAATRILVSFGLKGNSFEPIVWVIIAVYAVLVWFVTTVVLLLFAEAVVWMTSRCVRLMKRSKAS